MKLLLVMTHGCTTMSLREKHSIEREYPKSKREIDLRRRYCSLYSSAQMESCYFKKINKRTWREVSHHQEILQKPCLLRSPVFTKEFDRILACMVSNVFIITHLLSSACLLVQVYLADENVDTLPHPAHFPEPAPSDNSCSWTPPQKMSCWAKIQLKIIARVSHFPVLHS